MNAKDQILRYLARNTLSINKQFKDAHLGESCYIFGNGSSIKNMDLSNFSDGISIGCNHLNIHKDFGLLKQIYYFFIEPYSMYLFCRNPYLNKIQVNELGNLFRKAMAKYPEVKVFTSLSNRFGLYRQNTFYLHHFGNRQFDVGQGEMDGSFSFMQSSLHAMIGAAIYMGFKKAILVGCDYVFSPVKNGHFYCDNISNQGAGQCPFTDLFNKVSDQIQLSVMTSRGYKSQVLNSVSYEEYFSCLEKYREYEQIVDEGYLCILKKAVKKGQHGAVLNR